MAFHVRCGERVTLLNNNCTAVRNFSEFNHGLVLSAEPLADDVLFEVRIDKKINSWSGSIEIGVTAANPDTLEFPACATKLRNGSWIMSGVSVLKDGTFVVEFYGSDLEKLLEGDRVGVMRTSQGELVFYINGESQGVAAHNLPPEVHAVIDMYGKCVQVSLTTGVNATEHNNDANVFLSPPLTVTNTVTQNCSSPAPGCSSNDKLRFHTRCGSLVKLSANCRTAERRRPLDEFNNGVVMTHRCLKDNELFEIRIDRLVDKWSGSIEVGVTTHNPAALQFPATMTNMRSGTIMMSGCGILTNGKGTRREYGEFNLDELRVGDRVGMVRHSNGNLHYYINGLDQGVAAVRVAPQLWGVIDLYGMTIKVTIVDRDEREQQNLVTRRNTLLGASGDCTYGNSAIETWSTNDTDRLLFHPSCGTHADVINNGRTAHRPNASDDFNNGVVLTQRILRTNELFEVRLEKIVSKWAGSIEIGVTTHSPIDLEFPFTMTNVRSGTWMMTGNGVMHNGTTTIEQYGQNLDRLQVGDRVGVVRREGGVIHFCVNGIDQGPAASEVPEHVYGVIDLYGQAAQASIVESTDCASPDTINSSVSNITLYSDLRFHSIHGRNARISANGLTACRPRAFAEFNDAIIFSNRTLRDGEMFEITLDTIVERWCGSVELGVTAVRPDDISLPHTATDLEQDTVMLSGSTIMENANNLGINYPMDLDNLPAGVKIGVMRHTNNFIHFYLDGVDQGPACEFRHSHLYAVVDLYGQCTQVTIVPPEARAPYALSENSASLQATSVIQPILQSDIQHRFSINCGRNIILSDGFTSARRKEGSLGTHHCLVFSSAPLCTHEPFEIKVTSTTNHIAGCLKIGITDINLNNEYIKNNLPGMIKNIPSNVWYAAANEIRYNNMLVGHMAPSLLWLRSGDRVGLELTPARTVKLLINSEDIGVTFNHVPEIVWAVLELHGFVSSVQVTSLQGPRSPLRPSTLRLQDSLEFTLDHTNKHDSMLESLECDSPNYEFSEHHGKNIKLKTCKKVAKRIKSYNEGLVITNKPLSRGQSFMIRVDSVKENWSGSIVVGALSMSLETMKCLILPSSAFSLKGSVWLAAWDYLNILGAKIKSSYGSALATCKVGTVITLSLSNTGALSITVGTTDLGVLATGLPQQVHIVVDVYGPCEKVSIVTSNSDRVDQQSIDNDDADPFSHTTQSTHLETNAEQIENNIEPTANLHEKADLEQHEKESSSRSDTITDPENPLPSSSNCQMNQSIRENNGTLTDSVSQNFLKNLEIKNASKLASSTDNENINIGIQRMESSMTESEPNPHSQNHVDNLNIQTRNSMDDISSFISETLQIQHNINLNIQRSQSSHSFTVINDSNAPSTTNVMDNNPIPPDTLNVTSSYSDVENGEIHLQTHTEISSISGDSNPLRSNISIENLIERDCSYLGCVTNFKHSLVLPEAFFASEEPICFCTECSDEETSAYLSGWVRFKLRNISASSSDWWVAYYETKVDKIRAVLDHGQPLPTVCEIQGDSEKNERGGTKLILRENLEVRPQNTHHYTNVNVVYSISTAFEVRVRPGSISSSSSSEPQEWVTKEAGACVLEALLIKLVIT